MNKVILHVDINNFYASVAMLLNPALVGKPVVVCGSQEKRHGIVLAKNDIAKKAGVKTGDTINEARRKISGLVIVPPDFRYYVAYSKIVYDIYKQYTPQVESFGMDECWLDVTSTEKLFGSGKEIADTIRKKVREETGLTVSVGVSFTKSFAKLGSDLKKPDATTVIDRNNFKTIVWNLPVADLLYIGSKTKQKLTQMGIETIGELANTDKTILVRELGKSGEKIWEMANGTETDTVSEYNKIHLPESVSNGSTTERDINNLSDARSLIYSLSAVIGFRLRKYRLCASGVSIGIRDNKLRDFSRQMKIAVPTSDAKKIAEYALELLTKNYSFGRDYPIRAITVGTYQLVGEGDIIQSTFFDGDEEKSAEINEQMDKLRSKYGYGIVKRGVELNPDFTCDAKEVEEDFIPFHKSSQ